MGRYCSYAEIQARFRQVSQVYSSNGLVDSQYIYHAENELDSRLGKFFTVPFSSDNMTAKDLAIDMSYAKVIRYTDTKTHKAIMDEVGKRIDDLIVGNAAMITSSGDTMFSSASISGQAWSNTMSYSPIFGMDDEFEARY